jgi:uncharacterized protein YebE (UPF0316 family)
MAVSFPILCIIVCIGRIVDVALGTTRTIFTVKGKSHIAAIIGFIEAILWFLIVREALSYQAEGMETYLIAIAYALGYSLGTFTGGFITSKFIRTKINVQIISSHKNEQLVSALSSAGFGATILIAKGSTKKEDRYMILIETDNRQLKLLKTIIADNDPKAFVSISDIKSTQNGYFGNRV